MLRSIARALARRWPELLAWYLAGWVVRASLIELAAWIGNYRPLIALLIVPLAVLARLASYVAIFLITRDAVRGDSGAGFAKRWMDAVAGAILPFFVIYAAWGMFADDQTEYANASLRLRDFSDSALATTALTIPLDWFSLGVVALALAGRWALSHWENKLPRWTGFVAGYLEAVWVFVAVRVIAQLIADVPHWLQTRRMFAPFVEAFDSLRSEFSWFASLESVVSEAAVIIGDIFVQPLAWLALGSIVLVAKLTAQPAAASGTGRTQRLRDGAVRRWSSLPKPIRSGLELLTESVRERWMPIVDGVRLAGRGGFGAFGLYLLLFAIASHLAAWLTLAAYRLIGPHPFDFWVAYSPLVGLVVDAIVIPLMLVVVACAVMRMRDAQSASATVTTPAAEPAATAR